MQPQNRSHDRQIPEQRFRVGERSRFGIKDIGVEQIRRIVLQRVGIPREDPHIELRVGVIEEGVGGRRPDDGICRDDRQGDE